MSRELEALESALRRGALAHEEDAAEAARQMIERADESGLVEVAYATVDTPLGRMLLAGTNSGLVRVVLPKPTFDHDLAELSRRVSPRIVELPRRLDEARREIDEYFAGKRRQFDLPLDMRLITAPFTVRVLEGMKAVPYGEAITYTEAALRAGSPRAHRAAGNALGSNPIPLVIPCHRVVRTRGHTGGYGGGPEMKRFLLRHEGWLTERGRPDG